MKNVVAAVGMICLLAGVASAWWDTQVRAQKSEPLLNEWQAAELEGAADVRPDEQANGGRGGDVVYLSPGDSLSFGTDLEPSVYSVWIIARALEDDFQIPENVAQEVELPGGAVTFNYPRRPVIVSLSLKSNGEEIESWIMPVTYRTQYAVVTKMYFPLHEAGDYELSVGVKDDSEIGLLVDRLEVRDVLGNCARVAAKDRRMLTSDEDIVRIREEFQERTGANPPRWLPTMPLPIDERKARNDELWETAPAQNLMTADPQFRQWNNVIGREGLGQAGFLGHADSYEATANKDLAMDGAVLLAAFAEKYPGLDHYYTEIGNYGNISAAVPHRWGSRMGKTVYSGWEGPRLVLYATAYDKLFDFISESQELADYLHTRIPWIETPEDVVKFIDTNLLQHGMDALNRRIIRNDRAAAFVPLVQGINEVSYNMLADGLFSKVHYNMADAGGLDDQAFTSFNRGGVHYIGSMGYVGPALSDIADLLEEYVAAGGDPRFDLSDPERYPNMPEAERTKNMLYAAGGFPIIVGDSMDLRRRRVPDIPEFPSRVVEGFGEVVLEDGQEQDNPLIKRAVAIFTGIGRGHSHQDTLNIEVFAHGTRLAPDLGGRHEGPNRASPNMRINRMHNLVEIDERNFHNTFPGSTTSATGWNTAFAPNPGVQYMANSGRATSHPHVSLYHRSTAMIDGEITEEGGDMYLFDVFRIVGGTVHTYCFHGAYSETFESNAELNPATSELANRYMAGRPVESRVEGSAPDPLIVTWPLREELQRSHQAEAFQPDKPVGMTLALFGVEGEHVMVGSAESQAYPVDMPYLHVRREQAEEGLVSVYPAIYEAHAGGRFITGQRRLAVAPDADDAEAGVALEVTLGNNRRDTLFSSLKPDTLHNLEDGTSVAGEFGLISTDDDGIRMMNLVGGTQLMRDGIGVRVDAPEYRATIEDVDYLNHAMTLSADMPGRLLEGLVAKIGNERHWAEFQLKSVDGRDVVVEKTPRYYQSKIGYVDEENRIVATELEPPVYGADSRHADGTTVTNNAHDRFWKVDLEPRERWMYLGWPGTELSYPSIMTWEDIPDADGDGRRTVRLLSRDEREREERGDVILELEVTRVDPEENLFYFRMPEDPDYQQGGWQYANRILENEDGSKRWWGSYPGTSYAWTLEGDDAIAEEMFADTTGEGARKLYAYHFGPDDSFILKTFVNVSRVDTDLYKVRANAPCSITLPIAADARISEDGENFRAVAARRVGDATEISLSNDDLGDGEIWLRLAR